MVTPRYRCARCGNKTRFDVYETVRRRRYAHFTLGGEESTDEEEVLSYDLERVVCRWCDSDAAIEIAGDADPA